MEEYIDSELVILNVQKHPCLYDSRCEAYKHRNRKYEAWVAVAENVVGEQWQTMDEEEKDFFSKEIQKRWKSLKDAYIRSIKYREWQSGSGIKQTKPYVYQKQLGFLNSIYQVGSTFGNTKDETEPPEKDVFTHEARLKRDLPPPSTQKRKKTEEEFEILNKNVHESIENDPDRMFLLSLLPSLKIVKPSDKLDVQIKLMEVLKSYTSATNYNS